MFPSNRVNNSSQRATTSVATRTPELIVIRDNRELIIQELKTPGSTLLQGILCRGVPDEAARYLVPPDSQRWDERDGCLTNNFWTYALPDHRIWQDYRDTVAPHDTFGQNYLKKNETDDSFLMALAGHSIKYLGLTIDTYRQEIATVTDQLGFGAEIIRWNQKWLDYVAASEDVFSQYPKGDFPTEVAKQLQRMDDELKQDRHFQFSVLLPIFRALIERGFSLVELAG
jgi:hypothetical protein